MQARSRARARSSLAVRLRYCVACKPTLATHATFNSGLTFCACKMPVTADNALAGRASLYAHIKDSSSPIVSRAGAVL